MSEPKKRPIEISGKDAGLEICWDELGIAHVYAQTVADAYRGMGYAEGHERLWQIHLSCLYANGNAASALGERFVKQDLLHRAFDVPAQRIGIPDSEGDWIVDAYLDGLNAYVDSLDEPPPEFVGTGATPRRFTRADIASRYRFTSWFQHRAWPEKMFLGRAMARHGAEFFKGHVSRFSQRDAAEVERLAEPLKNLDLGPISLIYPDAGPGLKLASGSNNWAVTGQRAASGKSLLAMDPHQPHSIPNTFFYIHLHAGDWDVFGASFPGVPYFMMGYTRRIAWGLTTGMIDTSDVYIEEVDGDNVRTPSGWQPIDKRTETIEVHGGEAREFEICQSRHGPLMEPLMQQLGSQPGSHPGQDDGGSGDYRTAIRWTLQHNPTSAGTLARLPLATSAEEFGDTLFENDVTPLVNNIICVDAEDGLRRFIVATLPKRRGVTGVVPLAGWDAANDFEQSTMDELVVEINPDNNFSVTANNDTLGERAPYPIHTFPAPSARADRIKELIGDRSGFTPEDFMDMQRDLLDLRARELVPEFLLWLEGSDDPRLVTARQLLANWNFEARAESAAAALYYALLDRQWQRRFLMQLFGDDFAALPAAVPSLHNLVKPSLYTDGPWQEHREVLREAIQVTLIEVVDALTETLGDVQDWAYGRIHQVRFWHALRKKPAWATMQLGPDPVGGSSTTLAMAAHVGNGVGRDAGEHGVPLRVWHGPAYRLVVDLADPDHCRFVIASGNGGRPDSPHVTDHYQAWLKGEYFTVALARDELKIEECWQAL